MGINSIYIAASGANAEMAALMTANGNLANVGTPGYRVFEANIQSVRAAGSRVPWRYAAVPLEPVLSRASGPPEATGNWLDVYVTGNAFIAVRGPNGSELYTRNGQLTIGPNPDNPTGEPGQPTAALYAAGLPVLDENRRVLTLVRGIVPGTMTIAPDGMVSLGTVPRGRIRLVDPGGEELTPLGASLYRTASGRPLEASTSGGVRQGYLETTGQTVLGNMTRVQETGSLYQSLFSVIHLIDENWSRANSTYSINISV